MALCHRVDRRYHETVPVDLARAQELAARGLSLTEVADRWVSAGRRWCGPDGPLRSTIRPKGNHRCEPTTVCRMRDGVGLAVSLLQEAQRSAQRAVASFAAADYRSFVIDAGTTLEYLEKRDVALKDPRKLFGAARDSLSAGELTLLKGDGYHEGLAADLCKLSERRTMGVRDAIALSIPNDDDQARADRIRVARNAAIHIGEFQNDVSDLAADWLSICRLLYPDEGLWGHWHHVATPEHLSLKRSAMCDGELRIAAAQASYKLGAAECRRRMAIAVGSERDERAQCPACPGTGIVSDVPACDVPPVTRAVRAKGDSVPCFDCLRCGLILYGEQVGLALASNAQD